MIQAEYRAQLRRILNTAPISLNEFCAKTPAWSRPVCDHLSIDTATRAYRVKADYAPPNQQVEAMSPSQGPSFKPTHRPSMGPRAATALSAGIGGPHAYYRDYRWNLRYR